MRHTHRTHAKGTPAGLSGALRARSLVLPLLIGLAVWAAPALAAQSHAFSRAFGSKGVGAGQLSVENHIVEQVDSNLAVNDASGDVYVADTGNDRVDEFKADGTFVRAWGWGVRDGSTKALQTCTSTCFKGVSGSGPGEFGRSRTHRNRSGHIKAKRHLTNRAQRP